MSTEQFQRKKVSIFVLKHRKMKVNPEQWFEENKHVMPKDIVGKFEQLRMFLRGWTLYEKVHEKLANEMIAHVRSKFDNPERIVSLDETLSICANYYIMLLCTEVEATLRNSAKDYPTDFIDGNIELKNKIFDEALNQESWKGSKELLKETVAIFQNTFLAGRPELMDIESKWWQFYKYTFQLHGMTWQVDSYRIAVELRNGKKPSELTQWTHQKEFDAVKDLVDVIEEVERGRKG